MICKNSHIINNKSSKDNLTEIILAALVRYSEVLPTLATCAVAYNKQLKTGLHYHSFLDQSIL